MFQTNVLCVGSATVDTFLTVEDSFKSIRLGDKVLVKAIEMHSGGGATNAAAALRKLGLDVKVLTKLGNDHSAQFVMKELQEYKIKNVCKHHSRKHTDFATIISYSKDKDRTIYVHKGASQDLEEDDFTKSDLKAEWIYLASLTGKSMEMGREIANYAREKKIQLLFNPSLYLAEKGKTYLKPILDAASILVLNKEEAQALLGMKSGDVKPLITQLRQLRPEIVIITEGKKAAYAFYQGILYTIFPTNVKVVDTAGAGDAFTSGFLAGFIKQYSFADALRLGQVNAESVVQYIGTKNKLLTEKEAKEIMKKDRIKVKEKRL